MKKEGYEDNASLTPNKKFWWPFELACIGLETFRKQVKFWATLSSQNYKIYKKCHDTTSCEKQQCYDVPKRYGYNMDIISIHSKMNTQIELVLNKILHDSGIRYMWSKLEADFLNRRNQRREKNL